jgi:hypothetical protein
MTDLGRMLVWLGLILAIAGVVLIVFGRTNLPIGRLPGDIVYRGKSTTVYFPIVTSILLSLILTLVFWAIGRFRH